MRLKVWGRQEYNGVGKIGVFLFLLCPFLSMYAGTQLIDGYAYNGRWSGPPGPLLVYAVLALGGVFLTLLGVVCMLIGRETWLIVDGASD